ncbi:MAG: disulfide bond formation protein B [Polaromonas sp.]
MTDPQASLSRAWYFMLAAWLVALVATLSALFLGEVMGVQPCVLCWYQRIAMFPLVLMLGLALMRSDPHMALYGALLSLFGVVIAGYHTLLYWDWIPPNLQPCGQGPSCKQQVLNIFGVLDLPMLSFLAFTLITILLIFSLNASKHE